MAITEVYAKRYLKERPKTGLNNPNIFQRKNKMSLENLPELKTSLYNPKKFGENYAEIAEVEHTKYVKPLKILFYVYGKSTQKNWKTKELEEGIIVRRHRHDEIPENDPEPWFIFLSEIKNYRTLK